MEDSIDDSNDVKFAPFKRSDPNPGLYEKLKMFVGTFTLLPLRIIAALAIMISYFIVMYTLYLLDPDPNFLATHPKAKLCTRIGTRLLLFVLGFVHIKEEFPERWQKFGNQPLVIVSNHVSYIEILYLLSSESIPAFVMKQACARIPIVGFIATKLLNGLDIDHKTRGLKATDMIIERIKRMHKEPDQYRPLAIFPEGTTSNGEYLMPFRTGAFVPGVPVQPIYFHYTFQHFSCAFESILAPVHIFRMLTQVYNKLEVKYLEPYIPSDEEKDNPKLFAENVRATILKASQGKVHFSHRNEYCLWYCKGDCKLTDSGYAEKLSYHDTMRKEYDQLKSQGYHLPYLFVTQPHLLLKKAQ